MDVLSIPGGPCDKSAGGTSGRITGPLMAEQGKDLWDSGTLGRGGQEWKAPQSNGKGARRGF